MNKSTRRIQFIAAAAIMALLVITQAGCMDAQEFRAAASSSLQSGVQSIATGLIDGLFAVFDPNTTSSSSGA